MQPETETLPNGKKVVVNDEGRKPKVKDVADMTGPEQWDALAFKLILQELAPKGFSEIKRGPYRGTVQSNIPFLPKKTVQRCQNLAAQCVRSYRERAKRTLHERLANANGKQATASRALEDLPFWRFAARRRQQSVYEHFKAEIDLLHTIIGMLNETGIK